jgi:hypothetical protein
MLRIRTPRSFALTSPVPISQFDQSYVNLFTYSFIKCFLSVEHYWFPQFEYMITINSFHPFEDWVSWVVAQMLSGGRQIKTPANVNVYFYSFCRKGKKLTIISSKSRNYFAISRNKLQSQSIVSNCCFNFYILNQYFTCRHHICATSSLWGLFTVMFNYRIFLSSAFSTQIFCLDIFCSHLCCFDCLHSFRTVCFFCGYTIDQCTNFTFILLGVNFLSAPFICESWCYPGQVCLHPPFCLSPVAVWPVPRPQHQLSTATYWY